MPRTTTIACLCFAMLATASRTAGEDLRNIDTGRRIPDQGYCDQPYVVVTGDGHWLCTLTTGPGHEGQGGQHVVSTISSDRGKTWSPLVDIEPTDGPEASWVVPLVTPGGRVYAFYTYNGDKVYQLPGEEKKIRADVHGWYAMKYSDDHGKTWSAQRYRIPMRATECDRTNDWQGRVQMFWGIDKPKVDDGAVYFAFTKLGRYFLAEGEGWLYRSDNLLTEPHVDRIRWQLLPDGERGIRAPEFGSVQEEHNLVPLGDGRLFCVYRTTMGYPCHVYSSDGGRTWTKPEPMTYTPGGQTVKQNRACPKLWRCANGKFLFWYHLHDGRSYSDRNPAWITGGTVVDGKIHWSQAEILLYHDDPKTRMSYPDLIEQDGRYFVTETQKTVARVHEIDKTLLEGLWSQGTVKTVARKGLLLEATAGKTQLPGTLDVAQCGGLSLDLWLSLGDLSAGQSLIDTRKADGRGIALTTTDRGTLEIRLSDGTTQATWDCDPGRLKPGKRHHVVATMDAGPRIITFVIDGRLCDGGTSRRFGWGRFRGALGDVGGSGEVRVAPAVESLRLYRRYLRTSEAVGNFHAEKDA